MKSIIYRRILLFALVSIIFSSCSKYTIRTNVLVPADISISQDLQSVGVINRSLPERSNWLGNLVEGFLTGESIRADREGSMNAIRGAANTLNVNPRFRATLLEGEDFRGTGTKQFPIPLNWNEVEMLCSKYKVDGLISLETFDSDIFVVQNSRIRERKLKDGKVEKYTEYYAELRIRVNAGWRFYDNVNKRLIDQQVFWDEKMWTGTGLTPQEALNRLPSKRRAINDAAIFAGEMFAFRISPKWLPVSRQYFQRGKKQENFKLSKEQIKIKNYDQAARLIEPLTRVSDNKIAARACHNMAILAEMEGELNLALEWANKAYKLHKRSMYRDYVNILNTRIMDQTRLKEQLEGKQ